MLVNVDSGQERPGRSLALRLAGEVDGEEESESAPDHDVETRGTEPTEP
jgi:hypothetical protein